MFIPIGLIARLALDARDGQTEDAMRRAGLDHDRAAHEALVQELWSACTGPAGCLLILGGVDWSACAIDGVPITLPPSAQLAPTGYRENVDVLGPGPHGLLAVCPGRHSITVRSGHRTVTSAHTLFPREALFLKLDAASGAFARYESSDEAAILRRVSTGDLTLLDYSQHVASPRITGMRAVASTVALTACVNELRLVHKYALDNQEAALRQATNGGTHLNGVPIASFEPITTFIGFNVFELAAKEQHTQAWTLLQAGFAVLPDNPTLLAVQGELQLKSGATELGTASLERALVRANGLNLALTSRVRALLGRA